MKNPLDKIARRWRRKQEAPQQHGKAPDKSWEDELAAMIIADVEKRKPRPKPKPKPSPYLTVEERKARRERNKERRIMRMYHNRRRHGANRAMGRTRA